MDSRKMTDNCNMEGVQDNIKGLFPPPRKKIKIDSKACASQENASSFTECLIPTALKYKIHAREGVCNSILFPYNYQNLISGGKDYTVKIWDTSTGALTSTLQGFQSSVYELSISSDNSFLIAALTSQKLCMGLTFWSNLPYAHRSQPKGLCCGRRQGAEQLHSQWWK